MDFFALLLDNKRLHYVSCGEKTKNEINADNFAAKRLLPFEYNNELCGKKINKEKIKQKFFLLVCIRWIYF